MSRGRSISVSAKDESDGVDLNKREASWISVSCRSSSSDFMERKTGSILRRSWCRRTMSGAVANSSAAPQPGKVVSSRLMGLESCVGWQPSTG